MTPLQLGADLVQVEFVIPNYTEIHQKQEQQDKI